MESRGFFTILTLLIVREAISARPPTSICRQFHRTNETREVSYVEEYYRTQWGATVLATRINFRKDIVTKWMVVEMCCEGYEPSRDDEKSPEHCVPVCPSECNNGVCEYPNSCTCDPGYDASVNNITQYSECLPRCTSGCVGGTCVAPETCTCYLGYELTGDSKNCKPSCIDIDAGGPEHCSDVGICIAPNTCQCRDGYVHPNLVEKIQHEEMSNLEMPIFHHRYDINCVPICKPECPKNAFCNNPYTCFCDIGYQPNNWDDVTECHPVCEKPCHNGFCVDPNTCQCNDGYTAHAIIGSNLCEPICHDECVNGKCIGPNECNCLSGYEKLIVHQSDHPTVSDHVCIASCRGECGNGTCVEPDRCHCDPGYALENDHRYFFEAWQTCQPFCNPACKEGSVCIAPDTCSCDPGHDLMHDSTCKPSCIGINAGGPENCGDWGICIAPDACQCRDGYAPLHWMTQDEEIINRTKPIFYDSRQIDCFPACERRCPQNAACIAPNECHCVSGYQPNNPFILTKCLPICSPHCHNGFCEHPNVCQCHDGYRANETRGSNFCEPVCQDGCVNGTCVLPNQCRCLRGYEKMVIQSKNQSEISPNICTPRCVLECGNGICVAPDECHCNPGYVAETYFDFMFPDNICQPVCNPRCHDELFCVAPDHCQLPDTNSGKFETFQTRIIGFPSKECGHNGSFSGINGTCMCNYQSDIRGCTEPLLCAIIIVNDTEAVEEFRLLDKIFVLDKTNDVSGLYRSNMACQNECRISIFSNESLENIRNNTKQCYGINLHDSKTGLVFNITEYLVPKAGKNTNGNFICFVNAGFRCDIPNYELRKTGEVSTGVIAGAVFLVTIILALVLSICLTRKKIRKLFKDLPQKDEAMMDRSEATDSSLHIDDVSHL